MIRARFAATVTTAVATVAITLATIALAGPAEAGGSIEGTYSVSNDPHPVTTVTISSLGGGAYQVVGAGWEGLGFYDGGDYWGVFRHLVAVDRPARVAARGTHRGRRQPDGSIRVHGVFTDDRVGAFDTVWHRISEIGLRKSSDTSGVCSYIEQLPRPVKRVKVEEPDVPLRGDWPTGTVIVQALVGIDGRVEGTQIVKSVRGLDERVEESVRQWVLEPALACGQPVEAWLAIPFTFWLH
jgi:TonB family protein